MLDLAVPLTKDVLSKLATKATSSVLDKFEKKKIYGQGAVTAGRGFTLFVSDGHMDMNDIIKIVESLEKSGLLIDGPSETVKYQIKKQKGGFLHAMMATMVASLIAPMTSSLIQPTASLLINSLTERGHKDEFFFIINTTFNDESIGKNS